ncbi:long-chain acyl-CoA synthetase [Paucidesulfovibrio gracilis DSM 16080]|uniref:Long-chain acyl-CoA synthetase n=1 Tax=Paucidesulfovibrio gracilis DSM 16080 TaxID=1121449 RepID=A0A1T4WYE8_9BACT|nr:long-chain fatty acid--CoA ligase [Paucidesulfovibrio gracilis]SKA82334.1 long-chain acyl-CoA synthetase [Paucidesulfovibrio gracilis DSM 16080]
MADFEYPWLKSYDPNVPYHIDYESRPLFEFLEQTARRWPKRTAIVFQNFKLTYAKLNKLSKIFAANLRSRGLRPGDRVAVMLPNSPMAVIAYWGILRAGGVIVMTNPLYMETEIIHQFNDSGAKFLIMLDLLWPKIDKLRKEIPIEKFLVTSIADCLRFPLNWLYRVKLRREGKRPRVPFDGKTVFAFKQMLKGRETFTCRGIDPANDLALLQYTGGTTGVPKGCMITHDNLAANMQQCRAQLHKLDQKQGERFIAVLPYFHIYGLTVCLNVPTILGSTAHIFPRYVPKDLLKAIHKHKPTIFPGAPSVYISLLQQKNLAKFNLRSIKYCISGSAPMPVEYIEQFKEVTGAEIIEGYGLSEASPITHLNPFVGERKNGSIGLPFPDTEAKVVDMVVGGEELPPGKMGELVLRGPQVMKGYYNRPDDTADVLRNGWLYTGDIATMDEQGYFRIVDRRKDLIISAGYNIYPREIDEVLYQHPKIKEAVAVGIPSETRGEIVKVYLVLHDDEELTKSDIMAYCREKLAGYKVPRKVEFRDDLPKTMVGKVLRRALREEEEAKIKAREERKAERRAKKQAAQAQEELRGTDEADNPADAG